MCPKQYTDVRLAVQYIAFYMQLEGFKDISQISYFNMYDQREARQPELVSAAAHRLRQKLHPDKVSPGLLADAGRAGPGVDLLCLSMQHPEDPWLYNQLSAQLDSMQPNNREFYMGPTAINSAPFTEACLNKQLGVMVAEANKTINEFFAANLDLRKQVNNRSLELQQMKVTATEALQQGLQVCCCEALPLLY